MIEHTPLGRTRSWSAPADRRLAPHHAVEFPGRHGPRQDRADPRRDPPQPRGLRSTSRRSARLPTTRSRGVRTTRTQLRGPRSTGPRRCAKTGERGHDAGADTIRWYLERHHLALASADPCSVKTWARRRLGCRLRRRARTALYVGPGDVPPAPRLVAGPEPSPGTRTPLLVPPTDRAPASPP
jgi:hypothetical protein